MVLLVCLASASLVSAASCDGDVCPDKSVLLQVREAEVARVTPQESAKGDVADVPALPQTDGADAGAFPSSTQQRVRTDRVLTETAADTWSENGDVISGCYLFRPTWKGLLNSCKEEMDEEWDGEEREECFTNYGMGCADSCKKEGNECVLHR